METAKQEFINSAKKFAKVQEIIHETQKNGERLIDVLRAYEQIKKLAEGESQDE